MSKLDVHLKRSPQTQHHAAKALQWDPHAATPHCTGQMLQHVLQQLVCTPAAARVLQHPSTSRWATWATWCTHLGATQPGGGPQMASCTGVASSTWPRPLGACAAWPTCKAKHAMGPGAAVCCCVLRLHAQQKQLQLRKAVARTARALGCHTAAQRPCVHL